MKFKNLSGKLKTLNGKIKNENLQIGLPPPQLHRVIFQHALTTLAQGYQVLIVPS